MQGRLLASEEPFVGEKLAAAFADLGIGLRLGVQGDQRAPVPATTGRSPSNRRRKTRSTFTGPGVGELLHAATVAVVGEVPLDRLWHAVPAFPTVSEVWLRLLEASRA